MKMKVRSAMLLTAALVAVSVSSLAWACTPQPEIAILPASDAAARNTVEVKGTGFGEGPVAIRINSEQSDIVWQAEGPEFSQMVTLPADVQSGVYYLIASTPGGAGARAPYEITAESEAPRASLVSADLWGGMSQTRSQFDASTNLEPANTGAVAAGMALLSVGAAAGLGCAVVAITARRRREAGTS